MNLTQVILKDCRFRYIESDYEPTDYGINWTDVECQNLNVRISGIDFSNKQYRAKVAGLRFREKSGFEVTNMGGEVVASDDNLLVTNTFIQTERSKVIWIRWSITGFRNTITGVILPRGCNSVTCLPILG